MTKLSPAQKAILRRMGNGSIVRLHMLPLVPRYLTWSWDEPFGYPQSDFDGLVYSKMVSVLTDGGLTRSYVITPAGRAYLEGLDENT